MNAPLVVILIILAIIVFRLIAGSMDSGRIREYISSSGGTLISKSWTPFGTGWMGEQNARIYQISYKDKIGNIRSATVKTSLLSGVYLTQDIITKAISKPTVQNTLLDENKKLKQELEQLKKMQNKSQ
jgi:hypothetical protein